MCQPSPPVCQVLGVQWALQDPEAQNHPEKKTTLLTTLAVFSYLVCKCFLCIQYNFLKHF